MTVVYIMFNLEPLARLHLLPHMSCHVFFIHQPHFSFFFFLHTEKIPGKFISECNTTLLFFELAFLDVYIYLTNIFKNICHLKNWEFMCDSRQQLFIIFFFFFVQKREILTVPNFIVFDRALDKIWNKWNRIEVIYEIIYILYHWTNSILKIFV